MKHHHFASSLTFLREGVFRNRSVAGLLAVLAAWLGASPTRLAASAAPPNLTAYQGYLVDANGNPLAPTNPLNYPVIFRIYSVTQGGSPLWSEQQVVTVDKGYFNVLLGQGSQYVSEPRPSLSTVLAGANASELYVGITVTIDGNTQEMLPRLRLMTSPYAFLSTYATGIVRDNGTQVLGFSGDTLQMNTDVNLNGGTISGNGSGLTDLTAAQIPNLNASKITAGTLNVGRIPFDLGSKRFQSDLYTGANVYFDGGSLHMDNGRILFGKNSSGTYEQCLLPRTAGNLTQLWYGSGGYRVRNSTSASVMFMDSDGDIGLSTETCLSKLCINDVGWSDVTVGINLRPGDNWALGIRNGDAFKPGGGSWAALSDRRLKQDIGTYEYGLKEIAKLNTVRYHYRDDKGLGLSSKKEHYGFVAQDVQAVIPEAVSTLGETNLVLNLDLVYLAAVNAVKELNVETDALRRENADLKQRLAALEAGETAREKRLAALEKALKESK